MKDLGTLDKEVPTVVNEGFARDLYENLGLEEAAKILGIASDELVKQMAGEVPDLVEIE